MTDIDVVTEAYRIRNLFRGFLNKGNRKGLEKIIEAMDGRIEYPDPSYCLVQINADRSFVVNLSPYSMPARDTFSLAHAIGRVALHTPEHIEKPIKYDRTFVDKQTSEANIFAAILLMPKDRYLQAKERLSDDMRRVAWEFDVHQDNLKIRETLLHRGL